MSNLLHTRQRISELLGIFAWQAKAYTTSDFNKISEDVLVPLFRLIVNFPDLKNLNTETKKNFPGIDLADDTAGVAFQVTATSDSQKIKDSLRTFVEEVSDNNRLLRRVGEVMKYVTEKDPEPQISYSLHVG